MMKRGQGSFPVSNFMRIAEGVHPILYQKIPNVGNSRFHKSIFLTNNGDVFHASGPWIRAIPQRVIKTAL